MADSEKNQQVQVPPAMQVYEDPKEVRKQIRAEKKQLRKEQKQRAKEMKERERDLADRVVNQTGCGWFRLDRPGTHLKRCPLSEYDFAGICAGSLTKRSRKKRQQGQPERLYTKPGRAAEGGPAAEQAGSG